jgi:N-acetylmuramoyl-L-alanine amidase
MNIKKELLTVNPYSRPSYELLQVNGIIVHWVANPGTSAIANRNYFENRKFGRVVCKDCGKEVYGYELFFDSFNWRCRACNSYNLTYKTWKNFVSTHYIIGQEGEIIQNIPLNEMTYHTGRITNKETMKILGRSPNKNTIGIECCHIDMEGRMQTETYNSLVELVVYLLKKYNLDPIKNLFLHWHIYGKLCHKWFVNNPDEWIKFKKIVKERI